MGFIINPYRYAEPSFDPLSIAGCKVWLDAADVATITKDGSNFVSQWNDKSGEANHVAQGTGAYQPLYVSATNSIDFDGTDDDLYRATYVNGALSQPNTIFYVGTIPTANSVVVYDGGTNTTRHLFYSSGGSKYTIYAGANVGTVAVNGAKAQFTCHFNTSSSSIRRNKSSVESSLNPSTQTMNGIELGGFSGNHTGISDTHINEILVYNGTLASGDRDDIEDYLATKWGL